MKNQKGIQPLILAIIGLVVAGAVIGAAVYTGIIGGEEETTEFAEVITPVGRDSASGTRTSFEELVMEKENVTVSMLQMSSNGAVKETVASTRGAIGYVGLGYIDETVKAVSIDGGSGAVAPSVDTVLDGSYPISRSLYMITNGQPTGLAKDFLDFMLSADGQAIVEDENFVPIPTGSAEAGGFTGTLVIKGSTTVLPVAQAAAEAYMAKHSGVTIEVSGGGSSVGVSSAGEGSADIGMSSRDIKSTEMTTYPGLVPKTIAKDGIALIVHPDNPITSLTKQQVKGIYNGTYSSWTELLV